MLVHEAHMIWKMMVIRGAEGLNSPETNLDIVLVPLKLKLIMQIKK